MKHKFLLDENILYSAIVGVDEHDNEDYNASNLVRLIAVNCHRIVFDNELLKRYYRHLEKLKKRKSPINDPIFFLTQLVLNSEKADREHLKAPELPDEQRFPSEDLHIVRAAYHFLAFLVTFDTELRVAVNSDQPKRIQALHPADAIMYAKEK